MYLQGRRESQGSSNENLLSNYNIASLQDFQGVKICQMDAKWVFLLGTMQDSAPQNNLWKTFASFSEGPIKVAKNVFCSVVSHTWFPVLSSHTSISNPIPLIFPWNCRECCHIFPFQMQDFDNSMCISKKVLYFQVAEWKQGSVIISLPPSLLWERVPCGISYILSLHRDFMACGA